MTGDYKDARVLGSYSTPANTIYSVTLSHKLPDTAANRKAVGPGPGRQL